MTPASELSPVLLDTIRRLRLARLILRRQRGRLQALETCLRASLDLLHERDRQVDDLRAEIQRLREEQRRYVAAQVSAP